jgi:hypothetical protein
VTTRILINNEGDALLVEPGSTFLWQHSSEGTAAATLAAVLAFVSGFVPTYVRLGANAIVAGGGNLQDTLVNIPPTRIADIDEDVTADDTEWWTAVNPELDTDVRVGFPTPTSDPTGNQIIRVLVRATGDTGPNVRLELWQNGVKLTSETTVSVTSESGQLVTLNFDASELADATGANLQVRIFGEAA